MSDLFMELIQAHERGWGTEQYPERPSLTDLLNRPVVVFWSGSDKSGRLSVSVHNHVDELNTILLNMILGSKVTPSSSRRLSRLFLKQKPIAIKGVRLIVSEEDSK